MKTNQLKIISKVMFAVAGVLMFLALIMPAYVDSTYKYSTDTLFSEVVSSVAVMPIILYLAIGLGISLILTRCEKNQTIGSSLLLGSSVVYLVSFVSVTNQIKFEDEIEIGMGSIIGLISFVLVVAAFILIAIDHIIRKSTDNKNRDIEAVMQWKELEKNEIISHEEFIAKRDEILNYKKQ